MATAMPEWATRYTAGEFFPYAYTADPVAFVGRIREHGALAGLDVMAVVRGEDGPYEGAWALPGGFVDSDKDQNARAAALREFREETGFLGQPGYVEELNMYDEKGRDPRQFAGRMVDGTFQRTGARVITRAYVLGIDTPHEPKPLKGEDPVAAAWRSVYEFLPWEDRRSEAGRAVAVDLRTELVRWAGNDDARLARVRWAWGAQDVAWNEERAGERVRLLAEALLIEEGQRDQWGDAPDSAKNVGLAMAFDHRFILADALARVRGQIKYRPAFLQALLPETFPIVAVQHLVEAISGRPLDWSNLRRQMTSLRRAQIIEDTGLTEPAEGPGRPAHLYRFVAGAEMLRLDPALALPYTD